MNRYLEFKCGARLPKGGLKKPLIEMIPDIDSYKPEADGRHQLTTFSTVDCPQRPLFPDGTIAPCLFDCPSPPEQSGRRREKSFPHDTSKKGWDWEHFVTCMSTEVVEH
jgi:hypothetical protein